MADPMRIRAQMAGDKATVRVLMNHEMETGQRKDGAGRVVIGSRAAGEFIEVEIPAGYDEFELIGRISARLAGSQWDGPAYLAAVERNARERAKGK